MTKKYRLYRACKHLFYYQIVKHPDNYRKQLQKTQHNKDRYIGKQNALDLDDRHYDCKMQDYEKQIEAFYIGFEEKARLLINYYEQ